MFVVIRAFFPTCLILVKVWTDYNLSWNESEYGGLKSIRLPPNMIWKPDILMYNR